MEYECVTASKKKYRLKYRPATKDQFLWVTNFLYISVGAPDVIIRNYGLFLRITYYVNYIFIFYFNPCVVMSPFEFVRHHHEFVTIKVIHIITASM